MNTINVSATDSLRGVYSEQGAAPTTMTVINAMDMIGQVVDAALITWSSLRAGATTMSPTLKTKETFCLKLFFDLMILVKNILISLNQGSQSVVCGPLRQCSAVVVRQSSRN